MLDSISGLVKPALFTLLTAFSGAAMLASGAAADAPVTSCSALEGEGCCACSGGTCITVEHDGISSCTFEFCDPEGSASCQWD